ncbi:MAG: sulfatase-like hydrolase/transferase, partial [Planctomycetes bacterium]|nr:sulfatase-like hydrolase/transferase [Planctomycetota bacterium]
MIRALWTASFLLLVGCGPQSFEASSDAPNILLVVTDDLGWGDLGFRGSPAQTPHLDRLSEEGALLNRCYAQPLCTPTRVALLTGNMPVRYGLQYRPLRPWDRHGLPKSASLLPEKLQAAGYQTALIGKWHLGHGAPEHHPLRRGFDSFYGMMTGAHDYWTHERGGALDWQRNGSSLHEEGYSTTLLGLEAERFVRRAGERSQPWFLYLAFNAPHTPLQAPQERVDRLTGIVGERRATYLAMVEEMDAALGRVLSALDETKQTKETLVVFLNDNGGARIEGATNKPLRGGKGTAFEGGIRVPGMVRWPNSIPAGNHEQLIHPTDWTPTLLTAAGATVSADEFDGENLLEALQTNHPVSKSNQFFGTISEYGWFLAIIDGETKYVRRTLNDGRSFERLFDLSTDLGEDNDLSKEQPDTLARLATLADAWHALSPSGDPFMISEAPEGWTPPTDWADASRPEEALLHSANPPRPLHQKPNFVLIVADDLGTGDLGYLGGEMQTPHMDALAGQGLRFERFYSWALCTP